ncbi:MAG: hypothetical protein Q4A43_02765 [Coriobacteriia bacterium]|nr:hypothetical protein [Coriobacteriia bacterium]
MTIEFVAVFPVLLVVALISTNVVLFFSECAGFDREFRQEVARLAPSPAYGQTAQDVASQISGDLAHSFSRDYVDVSVSAATSADGLATYEGVITFTPTLFGAGRLTGAFGVQFPRMQHHRKISVDQYKPGVLL